MERWRLAFHLVLHNIGQVLIGHACYSSFEALYSPLPDLPTNLRSLNLATWFLKVAVLFLSSAAEFSSFPAVRTTLVPSTTSLRDRTLKGTGRVLLHRQCDGKMVQTKLGLLVLTSSPGYSASTSEKVLSPLKALLGSTGWWLPFSVGVGAVGGEAITIGIDAADKVISTANFKAGLSVQYTLVELIYCCIWKSFVCGISKYLQLDHKSKAELTHDWSRAWGVKVS